MGLAGADGPPLPNLERLSLSFESRTDLCQKGFLFTSRRKEKKYKADIMSEIRKMKEPGPGMAILGSGNIVAQLALEQVIDEYQMMVDPVALGKGRTMFEGIQEQLILKLTKSRTFNNGKVLSCYEPTG